MRTAIKLIIIFILFLLTLPMLADASVTLQWDANTEADLDGYCIHWGIQTGNYDQKICVPKDQTQLSVNQSFVDGTTYYFAATAFDTSGNESNFSNEVSLKYDGTAPSPPLQFKIVLKEFILNTVIEALQ